MLTRPNRLTAAESYARTVRRGRRAGAGTLVLHLARPPVPTVGADGGEVGEVGRVRVGFVVGKAVGPAVVRNLVKRRLRHLARERLASLPSRGVLVVRALPASAAATYASLAADFDSALARVVDQRRATGRGS